MYWQAWENVLGYPPSEPPEIYWNALLGHYMHLTPDAIGLLTPGQLYEAARAAKALNRRGR